MNSLATLTTEEKLIAYFKEQDINENIVSFLKNMIDTERRIIPHEVKYSARQMIRMYADSLVKKTNNTDDLRDIALKYQVDSAYNKMFEICQGDFQAIKKIILFVVRTCLNRKIVKKYVNVFMKLANDNLESLIDFIIYYNLAAKTVPDGEKKAFVCFIQEIEKKVNKLATKIKDPYRLLDIYKKVPERCERLQIILKNKIHDRFIRKTQQTNNTKKLKEMFYKITNTISNTAEYIAEKYNNIIVDSYDKDTLIHEEDIEKVRKIADLFLSYPNKNSHAIQKLSNIIKNILVSKIKKSQSASDLNEILTSYSDHLDKTMINDIYMKIINVALKEDIIIVANIAFVYDTNHHISISAFDKLDELLEQ